ncbi:MAG: DUF559 domain-containing protein [Bacteroidales bacterium]|nr:DUF559 domain-containing protein [Bacteroidales bacterium]
MAAEETVGVTAPVRGLARLVRRNPTEAERAVWTSLVNDRRLAGRGYKRRVPIARTSSISCRSGKTVLELDDGTEEPAVAVRRRTWLEERGYRVVVLPAAVLAAEGGGAEGLGDRLVEVLAPLPADSNP